MANLKTNLRLRRLYREDFPKLLTWLSAPHVEPFWDGTSDLASVIAEFEPSLAVGSVTTVFVIEVENRSIGMIQCYRHSDYPKWDAAIGIKNAAGIDYLIGEADCLGKGYGSEAIRIISQHVFTKYTEVEIIVSAPQHDNTGSWRALEKAGFRRMVERKIASDCPSDRGISYVYGLARKI
jgi:aminoglycoside 6'-N-acetyltransferase